MISLRKMIALQLITLDVYLEVVQVLKIRAKKYKRVIELESNLLEQRKNFRVILNSLELEKLK